MPKATLTIGRTIPKAATRPRPREKIPFRKGYATAKARAGAFAKQKRIRSIIGREKPPRVAAARLKQFAEAGEGEVLIEQRVNSSWVTMIHLVKWQDRPVLAISFKSGVTCLYPMTGLPDYERMSASASKGQFIWKALYHGIPGAGSPYILIGF